MKTIAIFMLALLLLFAGCIKTGGASEKGSTTAEQTEKTRTDLGISNSDLQIDDLGLDPTNDEFEEITRP